MEQSFHQKTCVAWGTYDDGKPRTRILLSAAAMIFGDLHECHSNVWGGVDDKSQIKGAYQKIRIAIKWLLAYPILIFRYLRAPSHDVVLVPYLGIFDVFIIYPFAKLRGARICLDIFISVFDTTVIDRRLLAPQGIAARLLYCVERLAIGLADIPLIDTQTHASYLEDLFRLPKGGISPVWVGVESDSFPRIESTVKSASVNQKVRVLFYGQFIPLHGIDVIVQAAQLLERSHSGVYEWVLIGKGQLQPDIDEMIREHAVTSITRLEWVSYDRLIQEIYAADMCLGIFNRRGKSQRVIPNKVFQILAAGKPLITAESKAMRELVTEEIDGIALVRPGDPQALVGGVLKITNALQTCGIDNTRMPVVNAEVVAKQLLNALEEP